MAMAQSGKISGRVLDAQDGQPLPGVNVVVDGTTLGTITDVDGYYSILNVSPGVVGVRASFVGYTAQLVEGVRIRIDQTTEVTFNLSTEVLEGDEVVITAERPVVQRDVSNSQLNVGAEEIEALPVSSVSSVVGLQAGIQGLSIRGGATSELSFNINGLTMRDERDNTPYTGISLASVQEVQVQTGGFNAEYGNVRSGVINVVTKEGSRTKFEADAIIRYSPAAQKNFGQLATDADAYWIRPFIDPEVAYTGTQNGAWDVHTQAQYPNFRGWIAVSEERLRDDNPANDMTPEALMQAFLFQHRKSMDVVNPDFDIDIGVGGPIVGLNRLLPGLRFFVSHKRVQDMYLIPLHTDRFQSYTTHAKVTTDLAPGMKLSFEYLDGKSDGTSSSRSGQPGIFRSAYSIASQLSRISYIDARIFSTDYWGPTEVNTGMVGLSLTHALSDRTFYEVKLNRFNTAYDTNPGPLRSEETVATFGGVAFDEAPFGFQPLPTFGVDGMRTGVGMSNGRDTSRVATLSMRADLTSQVNRFMQVKTGVEVVQTDTRVNYGNYDAYLPSGNSWSRWEEKPLRYAAYAQAKLEFQGMIANVGLRFDGYDANTNWYDYDAFNQAFSARLSGGIDTLLVQNPTKLVTSISPRVGVSFPVTETSKLFFNYGHFRSMPDPNNLYLIRYATTTGQITRIADPENPLPKTVAYEIGFEQALLDQYLIRIAGYYKDEALQPYLVNYVSRDGQVDYSVSEPNSYEDIRGIEFTLSKNRGEWLQGFFNYTYMVYRSGYFGYPEVAENPTRMREIMESDALRRAAYSTPLPRPYARLKLDLIMPAQFGPQIAGAYPLSKWRTSFITSWQDGGKYTWTGGASIPGVINNVDFRDSWNVDLRFSRNLTMGGRRAQLFVDVFNLMNRKTLTFAGFVDGVDQNNYLRSLHLPDSPYYSNVIGDDVVGDYREADVAYQPMSRIVSREQFNNSRRPDDKTIYFEDDSNAWIVYRDGVWEAADMGVVREAIDKKAYIDMPNQGFLTFLNPRDVYFGIRISL